MNGTMLQAFHWYTPNDGTLWETLNRDSEYLASLGFDAVWLPPATKALGGKNSVGYDSYDIYDLGEFDQKGSTRTKYGTKEQLQNAIKSLQAKGIQVYIDVVLNHMGGGDEKEKIKVRKVNPENRTEFLGEAYEIEAYTKFTFPGRNKKYSEFVWNYMCFSGVDYAEGQTENAIYRIVNEYGEDWEDVVDDEKGNYDFLMFNDIEFRNPAVREELKKWGKWCYQTLGFDGVRLDAVKHISPKFYIEWLDFMRAEVKADLYAVGEYWAPGNLPLLNTYLDAVDRRMNLFDAALHHKLHDASKAGKDFDLTTILDGSLVQAQPQFAVTVVDNHDTQPLQALEAPVEAWFKGISYALILLREGGYPCVFYPDLFGDHYTDKGNDGGDYEIWLNKCPELETLLQLRQRSAYGVQRDYFDHPNCIGWTREGIAEQEQSGCAVLISNSEEGFKAMEIGKHFAGKTFVDSLGKHAEEIVVNQDGWADFKVTAGSVCAWVPKEFQLAKLPAKK